MSVTRATPVGCGHYLPKRVVENIEFTKTLDTSDEWIRARTGIERRHFAADDERTSDLAINAAKAALANAGMDGSEIDAIVLATATPDNTFPSTAT
ncbi:MAG: 3-oxoacyl-ACP synthase, partial [Pikeienuella sp.]